MSGRSDIAERRAEQAASPRTDTADTLIGDAEFSEAFGEDLSHALDVDTWPTGIDWEGAVKRIRAEVEQAVERESLLRQNVRQEILPEIERRPGAPPEAGLYRATPEELAKVHEGLLFTGKVEAVDGTSSVHDTVPLGITQIGVAVVSYGGTSATFAQRVYRKEIAGRMADPFQAALEVIKKREARSGVEQKDVLSELARRGIMTYAERKILVDKSTAAWRLGHGAPAPYELLTGAGSMQLLTASLDVLRRMILDFKNFVFVPSAPGERGLLTIGDALRSCEYVIIDTIEDQIERIVENGHYSRAYKDRAMAFVRECGPQVLRGIYCASENAPPYLFYGHKEKIHIAARVALADSILRQARGFPMLIDVADATCSSTFGTAAFLGLIYDAYAQAGVPLRYLSEREMRR